jgi:putative transposase
LTTERGGPHGYDGAKKLSGRKRYLLVDTLGLVLGVMLYPADLQDCATTPCLLSSSHYCLPQYLILGLLQSLGAQQHILGRHRVLV